MKKTAHKQNTPTAARKKRLRVKLPWRAYILYLSLLTLTVSGVSLARYTTTISGSSTATVAEPKFTYGEDATYPTGIAVPANLADTVYTFTVSNMENSVRSDVSLDYTITVTSTGNMALTFALSGDNTVATNTGNTAGNLGTIASTRTNNTWSGGSMEHSYATTHTYTLTIDWGETLSYVNAGEIDLLTISVNWTQGN